MKYLNLIPPTYKDKLRLRRVYSLLKKMIITITLYNILLGLIILIARLILVNNFNRIVNETTLVTMANRKVEQDITNMNKQISGVSTIQKKVVPWPEFLVSFSKIVPDGVVINSLQLETDSGAPSTINGRANTREALLTFESELKKTPFLENVNLPFKNKLDKTNAYFTITMTIKMDRVPSF